MEETDREVGSKPRTTLRDSIKMESEEVCLFGRGKGIGIGTGKEGRLASFSSAANSRLLIRGKA